MLRRVALVRIDVSEERSAFTIRVEGIGEVGTMLAVTSNQDEKIHVTCHPDDAGATFPRNVCSYRIHTA
jgi:hypothetical protein